MQGMQADKIGQAAREVDSLVSSLLDSLRAVNRRGSMRATKLAPLLTRLELACEHTGQQGLF